VLLQAFQVAMFQVCEGRSGKYSRERGMSTHGGCTDEKCVASKHSIKRDEDRFWMHYFLNLKQRAATRDATAQG
jgi:hypothetical protein